MGNITVVKPRMVIHQSKTRHRALIGVSEIGLGDRGLAIAGYIAHLPKGIVALLAYQSAARACDTHHRSQVVCQKVLQAGAIVHRHRRAPKGIVFDDLPVAVHFIRSPRKVIAGETRGRCAI